MIDHASAINAGDILYGENSFGGTHASAVLPVNNGANVYVRLNKYYELAQGSSGCPSGEQIDSLAECRIAITAVGRQTTGQEWLSPVTGL